MTVPAAITPGIASRSSIVHASQDGSFTDSRGHTELEISRLQSSVKEFTTLLQYTTGDLVLEDEITFRNKIANTIGLAFDPNQWEIINSSLPVLDTTSIVKGDGDPGKQLRFEVDTFASAAIRVLTVPDANGTITLNAFAQTLTNKTIDADNNIITNIGASEVKKEIITGQSPKGTPVAGDELLLADSENSGALTKVSVGALNVILPVPDTTPIVQGSVTSSKLLRFEVDGNDAGITGVLATIFTTAKTLTFPDATDTLVGKATTDIFTNKTLGIGTVFSVIPTINAGITFTFSPTTVAGLNVGGITTNPTTQVDGDIWLNTTTNQMFGRISGANVDLGAAGGGTGDVVGPNSATDNALVRFDTTTGKLIQNSQITLDDTGVLSEVTAIKFKEDPNHQITDTATQLRIETNLGDDIVFRETVNDLFKINEVEGFVASRRIQGFKGPNVAAATSITVGDGNFFTITGGGGTFIDFMLKTDWQPGSIVVLEFDTANVTVFDQASGATGDEVPFEISGDFVSTVGAVLTVIFNGTFWAAIAGFQN